MRPVLNAYSERQINLADMLIFRQHPLAVHVSFDGSYQQDSALREIHSHGDQRASSEIQLERFNPTVRQSQTSDCCPMNLGL